MNSDRKDPVTLENLLRLKRAERPPAEFWTQFENELRAKQLAAIVEKRPFWAGFSRILASAGRYQVPIGAAAALALAFGGVREYQAVSAARLPIRTVQLAANVAIPAAQPVLREISSVSAAPVPAARSVATAEAARPVVAAQSAPDSEPLIQAVSVRNEFASAGLSGLHTSARSIDMNLASGNMTAPELVPTLFAGARAQQASLSAGRRQISEPLEQMTTPTEERRSRLLADALPAVAQGYETSDVPPDRYLNRLDDDRLNRSISRYDVGGDKLSLTVKF